MHLQRTYLLVLEVDGVLLEERVAHDGKKIKAKSQRTWVQTNDGQLEIEDLHGTNPSKMDNQYPKTGTKRSVLLFLKKHATAVVAS